MRVARGQGWGSEVTLSKLLNRRVIKSNLCAIPQYGAVPLDGLIFSRLHKLPQASAGLGFKQCRNGLFLQNLAGWLAGGKLIEAHACPSKSILSEIRN